MENIVLIGYMGSGKTTIGKRLAKQLGYQFIDTDEYIEQKIKKSVKDIFANEGEEYFRSIETETIKELLGVTQCVLSTGGGLPLRKENPRILQKIGKVYYLSANETTIIERLKGDTTRPLLQGSNVKEKVASMLAMRSPIYKEAADVVIAVDGRQIEEVVSQILSHR